MAENGDKANVVAFGGGKQYDRLFLLGLIHSYIIKHFFECRRWRFKGFVCMSLVDCTKINCLHSTPHYIKIVIYFCSLFMWGAPGTLMSSPE